MVQVRERSQIAEARWRALDAAARANLDDVDGARLGLIATEAASNLVKHAGGGEILVGPVPAERGIGVDLIAIDRGRGIANVEQALVDGFSTAGSAGTGLGGIRRQADRFDLFSVPNEGTVLVATVRPRFGTREPAGIMQVEGFVVPKPGETVAGDGWQARTVASRLCIFVCDGLGHGPPAAAATEAALSVFATLSGDDTGGWLAEISEALRPTRGAAVALAVIDPVASRVRFAGVGNIAGWLRWPAGSTRTLSVEGIVGRDGWRGKVMDYPFDGELLAIFSTDGLTSRWDPTRYRGLLTRDPLTISAVLYRDFRRARDDCTVVTARCTLQ